jgi:hypothetical protein
MPQANDAELTELYTSAPGLDVEDDEPNTGAPGGNPTANFQLNLEAVAGNVIGNGGGNYRLEITCIDETLAAPNASMSPGVLTAVPGRRRLAGRRPGRELRQGAGLHHQRRQQRPRARAALCRHHGQRRPRRRLLHREQPVHPGLALGPTTADR